MAPSRSQEMGTSADGGWRTSFVRRNIPYFIAFIVVFIVHFPQLTGWFQMDDFFHYHHLERQQSAWEFWTTPAKELDRFWFAAPDAVNRPSMDYVLYLRPLPTLWHKLDLALFGDWALAPHAENLLLHLLNVLLFLGLLRRLAFPGALPIALAFGVSPLAVEPVGWISSRNDLLVTCCMIVSGWGFFFFHRSEENKNKFKKIAVAFVLVVALWAGLLSKESAAMGIASALLLGLIQKKRDFFKQLWPYLLVAGTLSWAAYWASVHPDNTVSMSKTNWFLFWQKGPCCVLSFQFVSSLFSMMTGLAPPSFMHADLSSCAGTIALAVILFVFLSLCVFRIRSRYMIFSAIVLGLFLLPMLAIHSAPRYLYFCLPAFFAFTGSWVWQRYKRRRLAQTLFVVMIVFWCFTSHILSRHNAQGSRWIHNDLNSVREAVAGENVERLYLIDWWPIAINSELWLNKIIGQPEAKIRLLSTSPSVHRPELDTFGLWVAWLWSYPLGLPYDEKRYNCLTIRDRSIFESRTVPKNASLAALFDAESLCEYWKSNKVVRAPDVTVEFRGESSGCPNRMNFILPTNIDAPGTFVLRRTPEGFRRIQQNKDGSWEIFNPPICSQPSDKP